MANPRFFSPGAVGNLVGSLNWIFDSGQISSDGNSTGMWRALTPTDLLTSIDSVNISGISVNTDQLETITTSGTQYLAFVSGRMAALTTNFAIITGSQVTIPAGTRSWSVGVQSGAAYINNVGPYVAQMTLSSEFYTANAINVGGTGVVASPTCIYVIYES